MNKRIFIVALILCIFISIIPISNAQIIIPEVVRIGLYAESTSVSSLNVSAEKGLTIGSLNGGVYSPIFSESSSNPIIVRKDSYFVLNNNKFTEYKSTDNTIPSGEKLGPYHIKIGADYQDLSSANAALSTIKGSGTIAYLAFVDSWQIWSGFFIDTNSAQVHIQNAMQAAFPGVQLTVIEPNSNRIVVTSFNGDAQLIFGSNTSVLRIQPLPENNPCIFKINSNEKLKYRGGLEFKRYSGSDMTVVNTLPMDQYLYGVVPAEIGSSANIEALKAQAVAARTYTMANLDKHKKFNFNLCRTTACQVYSGYSVEQKSTNTAVDQTSGNLLTYNNKIAEVFYFSSSGGKTEDAKNVWGYDIPYLKSVEDKYESGKSTNYNWETTLSAQKIKEIMQGRGYNLGEITSVEVTKVSDAGRVLELVIKGTKDQKVYKLGNCRTAFSLNSQWYTISSDSEISFLNSNGPYKTQLASKKVLTADGLKDLPSSNVTILSGDGQKKVVSSTANSYKIVGKGWGHGIGLSQEGAKGMANAGFKYDEILTHYFPGTVVEKPTV